MSAPPPAILPSPRTCGPADLRTRAGGHRATAEALRDVLEACEGYRVTLVNAYRRVLAEAARVARRRIIVKDHHWHHRLDWLTLAFSDYLGSRAHGIRLPYNYLRLPEWEALFAAVALREHSRELFRHGGPDRCEQVVFVLEVGGK